MRKNNLIYYIAFVLFVLISLFFSRTYSDLISYTELTSRAGKVHSGFQNIRILVNNAAISNPHPDKFDYEVNLHPKIFADSQSIIHQLNILKATVKDSVNIEIAAALDSVIKSQLSWMLQSNVPDSVKFQNTQKRNLALQKIESLIDQGIRRTDFVLEYRKNKLDSATANLGRWLVLFVAACIILILYSTIHFFRQRSKTKGKEKELEISNRLLKNAQQIAGMGNWEFNISTGELYWSDEVFNIWGIAGTAGTVKNEQFVEPIHPDDRPLFSKQHADTIAGQNEMNIEHRVILQNGLVKWVHEKAKLVKDKQGRPIALEGTVQDITERKHTALELLQNESKYRSLFENSLDGILLTTMDGKILAANPAACAIFKMPESEICLVGREGLVDNTDPALHQFIQTRRLEGKVTGELRFIRKGGEIFPAEVSSSVFKDALGEERTCMVIRDIRERKMAEEKLDKSENRFRALIENNDGIISLIDEKLTVLFRSSSAARITGWTNDEFAKIDAKEFVHPDDLAGLIKVITTAVSNPAKVLPVLLRVRHKNGYYIWLEGSVCNMIHDPAVAGIITNMRDISKRVAAEQKIIKANRLYFFISHINQMIVRTTDEDTLFKEACNIAVDQGKFRMAWIGMIDEATQQLIPVISAGEEKGYLDQIKILLDENMPEGKGPTATAIRAGKFIVCNDISNNPQMAPWTEAAAERGYRSSIALPITKFGKVAGTFNLYASEIDFFDPEEISLLQEATGDLCFALENFEKDRLRKKAELELEKVNERLLVAQQVGKFGYWQQDLNSNVVWASKQAMSIYGFPEVEGELPKEKIAACIIDLQKVQLAATELVAHNKEYNIEIRINPADGSPMKFIAALAELEQDEMGKPVRIVGTLQDITERKKAAIEIERVSREKETALNRINDGVLSFDNDWRYTFINDAALNENPLSKEETIGKKFLEVHPELEATPLWKVYLEAMHTKKVMEIESFYEPYGIWVYVKIYPSADGLTLYYKDISESKKAEEALNSNRVFIESIIKASPDIIYIYDIEERKNIYVNEGIESNLGYTREEIQRMGSQVIPTLMHPADFEYYLHNTYPRYATAKDKEMVTHEYRMKDKSGNWHWFYCKESVFLRSADGGPKQIFGITTDITDRKNAEAEIIKIDRLYSFISRINQMIVRTTDEATLFNEACRIAVETGNFKMAWIGMIDNRTKIVNPVMFAGAYTDYLTKIKSITVQDIPEGRGPTGKALREGKYIICNDIENDPDMSPWKEAALSRGFYSSMSLPIKKFGEVVGAFTFYAPLKNFFDAAEILLLQEATNDVGFAMEIIEKEIQRKKAEAEIIKEKNLSDSIINSMPGVFYLYNMQGKFLRWNRNMELVTKYSPAEIAEMHPLDFFDSEDGKLVATAINNVFILGEENIQAKLLSKSKEKIPYYFTGIAISYEGSPCVMGVGIDMSESVAAQEKITQSTEQLRQLALHLQTIREDERKRIGREIHDELGQQLTAINMDVAWINKKIPEELTPVKNKLKNIIQLLNGSNQSIRRILNELRPVILDNNGLRDAIEWLVRQFTENTGIPVQSVIPDADITASEQVTNCIFRAYQEAFTNITRYAHAGRVATSLSIEENSIIVTIEDDGVGFDLGSVIPGKSFGILGMKERVISLGGVFELDSSPGKGTKIVLRLPVNNQTAV